MLIFEDMYQFALTGNGARAEAHISSIAKAGTLKGVVGTEELTLPEHTNSYADIDELLAREDFEVLVVCSATGLHAEVIIKALQARKHVVCEGPLCLTSAAAWQIIETAKFCRREVFMLNINRYNPLLKAYKKQLQGNIRQFSCTADLTLEPGRALFPDGGLLYGANEVVDTMVWLMDEVAESGTYLFQENERSVETHGVSALKLKNGSLGTLSWKATAKAPRISLCLATEHTTYTIENLYTEEQRLHHDDFYHDLSSALSGKSNLPDVYEGMRTVTSIEKIYPPALTPAQ